ncbi:hypothetical protein [Nitrobacter sp.]|uniref:hypothetical protein n=1 Tax=Nitrobacter sp. TaxID=29420 RepID=UPI003F650D85
MEFLKVHSYTERNRAHQANSDRPRYFILLKSGRLRPVDVQPGTFCVRFHGRWHIVVRGESDAEFFRDHPEAAWRFTTRRLPFHHRDYFEFTIVTRDGRTEATGDRWDFEAAADLTTGSFQDRMRATAEILLADPNRAYTLAA